ncbi:MAG: 30S ribosomal protein S14 [Bdellovibrionales bacterium]|nr:30S ribosomal protein S14 [Bdellovibrionales bacterium]
MAKKSKISKNLQRIAMVKRYAERRAELKELIRSPQTSDDEREEALRKFHALPRNSSRSRIRNRCHLTGRPRGNYRKFGLCRIKVREKALSGELPGVTKSSW